MSLENLIAFILILTIRNRVIKGEIPPNWKKWVHIGLFVWIALFFIESSSLTGNVFPKILSFSLIGIIVYGVFKFPEFNVIKNWVYAVLPLIATTIVGDLVSIIFPDFYSRRESYFELANFLAIVWVISFWYNARKQRKALEAERKKAEEREKEFKITEALKAQLEIQVAERTAELRKQKEELELAIQELKATQSQLIHAEKMASLGELTAGIAHEIQNPLNFVNNFSEVSAELVEEILEARSERREKGIKTQDTRNKNQEGDRDKSEDLEDELLEDIKQNLEKIQHHGKRADAIVKGMLQHSRSDAGQQEMTDINALADEYLRLSYHGLRAKDKSFNANFKTDFDPDLPKVNVVPQDLGRVLLNLINNAFQACTERSRNAGNEPSKGSEPLEGYQPLVTVSTKNLGDKIEISVKDNGPGIPEAIKDKIFQPFFTTKPTGQGTGLGLSLSYDIVKAHGGELKVKSHPAGKHGTEFITELPVI